MNAQNQTVIYPVVNQKAPKNLRRKFATAFGGVGTALIATASNAALDVSALSTDITAQKSNIETLGLAILAVLVVLAGIALLRRVIH